MTIPWKHTAPVSALVLTDGLYNSRNGKVAHGLIREGSRFRVVAVIDSAAAGSDAGMLLDGVDRNIPILSSLRQALEQQSEPVRYCVVGVATHGGRFTPSLRSDLLTAAEAGLAIINGLHDLAGEDPDIIKACRKTGAAILDLRNPGPTSKLHFWDGIIHQVRAPRIAILGMDCAIGKRTTTRLLLTALRTQGLRAEMIYTGQTGWMQGSQYGLVLDALPNDYVSGELEHAIVRCDSEQKPDVILLEGQSSLRNPSGPCGAELLLSASVGEVILQHAPARTYFDGCETLGHRIPTVEEEIELIKAYGARVLAITLNTVGLSSVEAKTYSSALSKRLGIPVMLPLEENLQPLVEVVRQFLAE